MSRSSFPPQGLYILSQAGSLLLVLHRRRERDHVNAPRSLSRVRHSFDLLSQDTCLREGGPEAPLKFRACHVNRSPRGPGSFPPQQAFQETGGCAGYHQFPHLDAPPPASSLLDGICRSHIEGFWGQLSSSKGQPQQEVRGPEGDRAWGKGNCCRPVLPPVPATASQTH